MEQLYEEGQKIIHEASGQKAVVESVQNIGSHESPKYEYTIQTDWGNEITVNQSHLKNISKAEDGPPLCPECNERVEFIGSYRKKHSSDLVFLERCNNGSCEKDLIPVNVDPIIP